MKYILTILLFFQFANCEAQIRKHHARPVSYSAGAGVTYATWNPSDKASGITLSGSDLIATGSGGGLEMVRATIGKSAGSWYWEITITAVGSSKIGIAKISESVNGTVGDGADGYGYQDDGQKRNNGSNAAYGASFTTGDVMGVAFDASAGTLTFYKNGVSQGIAFSGLSGTFYPAVSGAFSAPTLTANFGATAFTYSPPGGYNSGVY